MELWIDARYIRAGYGWSFPASDELRVGVGSFWPAHHVKEPTVRLARDLRAAGGGLPGQLDPARAAPRRSRTSVFFVGDSAGHCLPLTAEGIRTALYFGDRLRARAARRRRRTRRARGGAAPLRRVLGRSRAQIRVAAAHPARDRAPDAEPLGDRARARLRAPRPLRGGPSTTTCRSPRPRSRTAARRSTAGPPTGARRHPRPPESAYSPHAPGAISR